MYEFVKKVVNENAKDVALYEENGGSCKNQGICGSTINGAGCK